VIRRPLPATAVLVLCLGHAAGQEKDRPPKPIPEEEWEAWVTAGAPIGVMTESAPGLLRFKLTGRAAAGDLPAFRFEEWPPKRRLADLPAVTVPFGLDLHGLKVTDEEVKGLARLANLRLVRLDGTGVTDAGLKHLAGLGGLQVVDLGRTPVSDAGLKAFAGHKNLRMLLLDGTKVTDAGLKELAPLKSLRAVNVRQTGVTAEGVRQLQAALPDCHVVSGK
jgi:hypothetical protein